MAGMPHHLVEWFRADADQSWVDHITAALGSTGPEPDVRLIIIIAVPSDEVIFGLFAASSSETLRQVCVRAGVPPQRLTTDVQPTLLAAR